MKVKKKKPPPKTNKQKNHCKDGVSRLAFPFLKDDAVLWVMQSENWLFHCCIILLGDSISASVFLSLFFNIVVNN